MNQKITPYNTGKVLIGKDYVPPKDKGLTDTVIIPHSHPTPTRPLPPPQKTKPLQDCSHH